MSKPGPFRRRESARLVGAEKEPQATKLLLLSSDGFELRLQRSELQSREVSRDIGKSMRERWAPRSHVAPVPIFNFCKRRERLGLAVKLKRGAELYEAAQDGQCQRFLPASCVVELEC
jgi:hypothetical protein